MKTVVYAPAATARLEEILTYTWETFGAAQAEAYTTQLIERLEALASGRGPRPRSCELLMESGGLPATGDTAGLSYYREGMHFLILRDTPDRLEVIEILHARMNLDHHLRALSMRRSTAEEEDE